MDIKVLGPGCPKCSEVEKIILPLLVFAAGIGIWLFRRKL